MKYKARPQNLLSAEQKVQQDLMQALRDEPFPIRGWKLTIDKLPGIKEVYPIYSQPPVMNTFEQIPVAKPAVLRQLKTHELHLRAQFRIESIAELGGQKFRAPQEAVDRQWMRFANTNGVREVTLDAMKIPPHEETCLYPDHQDWVNLVEEWRKKWIASNKYDKQARWVLAQLKGIKDAGNHALHQALGRLVNTITNELPDYCFFIELALANRLLADEITSLNEYHRGAGALIIHDNPRPLTEPSTQTQ